MEAALAVMYDPIMRIPGSERGGAAGMQVLLPDGPVSRLLAAHGVLAVDMAVLEVACLQLGRWASVSPDLILSVPMDAASPSHPEWRAEARRVILASAVNPQRIEFSLTPKTPISDVELALANVEGLSDELGTSLALLGFGTGYSSLSTVHGLPVLRLEVSAEFGAGLGEAQNNDALTSVSQICRSRGMTLSASEVQNLKQVRRARSLGCEFMRVPVFAKPMLADAALAWLVTFQPNATSWR